MSDSLAVVLGNFSFFMVVLAVFFMVINRLATRGRVPDYEIIYRWIALFCLGFTGIYTFVMHAYLPVFTAASIGWANSPFQFEVAVADLAFGMLGLLSFNASYGFRVATVIGNTIWLWGDATGHIYQMLQFQDFAFGNAGSWLWMDVAVPLILVLCVMRMRRARIAALSSPRIR